jgi:hypothetical protein
MKPIHWVLLVVVLGGGGFAAYWFLLRKPKPGVTPATMLQPTYTAPRPAPTVVTRGATPVQQYTNGSIGQVLAGSSKAVMSQAGQQAVGVLNQVASKAINAAGNAAIDKLGDMFANWGN